MLDDFQTERIEVGDLSINVCHGGAGPPLLLLHGYPQTHAMWHRVGPELAQHLTVVCPDLRGYGDSDKPPGRALDCGHFIAEDRPAETTAELLALVAA